MCVYIYIYMRYTHKVGNIWNWRPKKGPAARCFLSVSLTAVFAEVCVGDVDLRFRGSLCLLIWSTRGLVGSFYAVVSFSSTFLQDVFCQGQGQTTVWNPNVICSEHSTWLSRSCCWPCQDNTHLAFIPMELRCCQPRTMSYWERKTSCLCLWAWTTCSVSVSQEMTRLCFISRLELLFTASHHPVLCQVAKGSTRSDGMARSFKGPPRLGLCLYS